MGELVWLLNCRDQSRKGGKFNWKWNGPEEIVDVYEKGVLRLAKSGVRNVASVAKFYSGEPAPAVPDDVSDCLSAPVLPRYRDTLIGMLMYF